MDGFGSHIVFHSQSAGHPRSPDGLVTCCIMCMLYNDSAVDFLSFQASVIIHPPPPPPQMYMRPGCCSHFKGLDLVNVPDYICVLQI